jgi:hypothetical protein
MNKEQLLEELKQKMQTGEISETEINSIAKNNVISLSSESPSHEKSHTEVSGSQSGHDESSEDKNSNLVKIFYGIGAIIVAVGVVILIAQNWSEIGIIGKTVVTLGIGLACYIYAFFAKEDKFSYLSQILFGLSAFLMMFGVIVVLNHLEIMVSTWLQFWIALAFFGIFAFARYDTKRDILVLIMAGFATWAYYALFFQIFDARIDADWVKVATIVLGVSYLLFAYDFQKDRRNGLVKNILYGLGVLMILVAAGQVGGIFDLVQILLIFAAIYLSVFIKSRTVLVISTLFLIIHIVKLTSEYFVDSIGWPLALIVMGFATIGIGYMSVFLNKKFIEKTGS